MRELEWEINKCKEKLALPEERDENKFGVFTGKNFRKCRILLGLGKRRHSPSIESRTHGYQQKPDYTAVNSSCHHENELHLCRV